MTQSETGHEVVFDARWLYTGIGRYILTLLGTLKKHLANVELTCIVHPAHVDTVAPLCDKTIECPSRIYSLSEQFIIPRLAPGATVFCAPHYNIPLMRSTPKVVTIHDITHLVYPQYAHSIRSRLYAYPMLKAVCARAAAVVTPSEYTRRMLIERLAADPAKIKVIPCAIAPIFRPMGKGEAEPIVRLLYGISGPFLLCISSTAPHKNLSTLLAAHQNLCSRRRRTPPLVLVLPRHKACNAPGEERLPQGSNHSVRCVYDVTDYGLSALYSAAIATIVPSHEEGFGYPVVESMACGTPVVCSSAASLAEVAGGCAELFSPSSMQELEEAISRVLESQALREGLAACGLERARAFTADRAGHEYSMLLRQIIQGQSKATPKQRSAPV